MTPPRRSMTADWEAIMPDKNLKCVSEVMEVCRYNVRAQVRDAQEFQDIWDPLATSASPSTRSRWSS